MKKGVYKRNLLVPFLKILSDSISIGIANLFAYYLRFYSPFTQIFPVTKGIPPLQQYLYFTLFNIIVFLILFSNFRSYRSRFFSTFSEDISVILKVSFLAILFSMSFAFLNRDFSYSRLVFILVLINSVVLLLFSRYFFHKIKNFFLIKGYNILNVILAGSPSLLPEIFDRLNDNNVYKFEFCGYVSREKIELPLNYIGDINDIDSVLDEGTCDGIILAFDSAEHYHLLNILKSTEGKNIELFYVPDILDLLTSHINVLEINGTPLFQFKSFSLSGWQGLLKRVFDVVVAILGICLLFPLFIIIAFLIKITSKGPVFYLQKRVSLDGTEFIMIKFRSMKLGAESETGPVWATADDSRTTAIGKFLRRTSLDELPQLWNIIKGDMSLVGPRPERQHFIDQFKNDIPQYLERHRLRSGVTGWAQVNGLRGQSPIAERTKYDLYYIENWSLWFDIKIIILTFIAIFKGENAY